jgi:hypothetical protein
MRIIKNFVLFLFVFWSSVAYSQSQPGSDIEMADKMKAEGKIYVVVGVVLIILVGLLIYLMRIERKVTKMEKEMEAEKAEKK